MCSSDLLAFWNAAIRTPLMDPKEFENEKKVVISEISGYAVDSGHIYGSYITTSFSPTLLTAWILPAQ